ncbi:Rab family GTPase [Promethearchaeum syntrophicum]|uniref:Rab family GTPase n=1 Tax=Promethearchaeum syntrophicum TaxID=2594042 RepID=A0A5B9DFZ1_9ARCH|nr:Rab family GTPase [Candidatus Prometheoarchaeum syntrophicum]
MLPRKICKITIAGDGGSGKSTMIATKNIENFNITSGITIGIDFACFPMKIENQSFTFLVFDLGGQKRFQFMHDSYIIGSKGAIILYDLSRPSTFKSIPKWISLMESEDPSMPIIIAGSKKDLIQPEDMRYFLNEWENMKKKFPSFERIIDHVFISSKDYHSVEDLFTHLGRAIIPDSGRIALPTISVSEN